MHESFDQEALALPGHGGHRRLGIVGGGQLASMTAAAARRLGCDVLVLERYAFSPASHLAGDTVIGNWDDPDVLKAFAARADVVTIENEFIDVEALAAIELDGGTVFPRSSTLRLIQDKVIQKQTLVAAGLPVPAFRAVDTLDDLRVALTEFGLPAVLKARRNGYDGKGNATIHTLDGAAAAWAHLGGGERALYLEAFCDFTREVATIVTRSRDGATAVYPVVETVQRHHICHEVLAPAPVGRDVHTRAVALAVAAIDAIDGVGSFGVEMFVTADDAVVINELAPRVHNSGHYSIEACACSQFENHVRAVMGWPLGSPDMVVPAAVMVNLLGAGRGHGEPRGLVNALAVPRAHVHVYGKAISTTGRKMGHVTALGASLADARDTAERAAAAITFGVSS